MPRQRQPDLLRAVGARLQQIRKEHGWTQEALAEAVGIEPVSLSRLETGDRALSLTVLARASTALSVSLGDLLDIARPIPATDLPADEAEAQRLYRGLDVDRRDLALRLLREVAAKK